MYLLGGMDALLLHLAQPRVAVRVAEHSNSSSRIFDRLQHTVGLMVEIGIGEPADAERVLHEMDQAHKRAHGSMPDGRCYRESLVP